MDWSSTTRACGIGLKQPLSLILILHLAQGGRVYDRHPRAQQGHMFRAIPTIDATPAGEYSRMMPRHASTPIPPDLRSRLEAARLDLLALFQALDQMDLLPAEIPQRLLRQLFELDYDYVQGLWALDKPPEKLDVGAMVRDTLAALEQHPEASDRFKRFLPERALPTLANLEPDIRKSLSESEAYNGVPGRDPEAGNPGAEEQK
jgi:hypothetical protein